MGDLDTQDQDRRGFPLQPHKLFEKSLNETLIFIFWKYRGQLMRAGLCAFYYEA